MALNPHLAFWTGALVDLGLIVGFMLRAVCQVRRGEVAAHRRSMLTAVCLVGFFLLAYVAKVFFLGREALSLWSSFYVGTLRFHESCVLVLLLGGGVALACGHRLRGTRLVTRKPESPVPSARLLRVHRVAGRSALFGAVLGFASAAVVLVGMYGRA